MKKIYAFIAALGMIAFSACQNEDDLTAEGNVGYLTLEVGTDNTTITKAEEAYDPEQIAVQIIDATGKVVKETEDYTTWTEAIALTPGKYKISASSNGFDGKSAAFDKPYYAGLDSVTIVKGEDAKKTVTCTLANVLVTVEFDDAFKAAFKTAEIDVIDTLNASTSLSFTKETAETMKGYFPVTGMFADLVVTNQKGTQHSRRDTVRDVKARDNVILRYKVAESENGSTNINVTLDGSTRTFIYTIGVPTVAKTTLTADAANAWSSFAYLSARYSFAGVPDNSKFAFEYQADGSSDWTKVSDLEKGSGNTFTAKVTGLTPATKYKYRLSYNDGEFASEPVEFTTEEVVALYNGNLDSWWRAKEEDTSPWYSILEADATSASSDSEGNIFSFWDSGNGGTAMMSANPTKPEAEEVHTVGGQAAILSSQFVGVDLGLYKAGKFAAGNLFTGHFCKANISTYQARIMFGQPFTSRPTQLKGWFKYNRGETVDYPDGTDSRKTELQNSGGDQCSVYIALTDNEGVTYEGHNYAYEINGDLSGDNPDAYQYKNAIDFTTDNKDIIAYGTITEAEAKGTGSWQQFTIDLKYRDLTRVPKYIIVVASASKYGDYFTGSTSSVMYIDDFELVYGDSPVVEEKTETEE